MGIRLGLLGLLLVLVLGSGVVAQSPTPETGPPFVGRVELPEHGLAVNIPEDWVGLDPSGDLDGQLFDVAGWLDEAEPPTPADGLQRLWDLSGRDGVPLLLVALDATQSACVIQLTAQSASTVLPRAMLEPVVQQIHAALLEDDTRADIGELLTVSLPIGEAWVITSTESATGQAEASYWVGHGDGVLWVLCQGDARPQDDWLSVAEAIEPLPEPTDAPLADG